MQTSVLASQQWRILDTIAARASSFLEGRFGFRIAGRDEIVLSDFRFTPR